MQQENVVRARNLPPDQGGEMVCFTREEAGWEWMSFVVTRLLPGQVLELTHRGRGDGPGMVGRTLCRELGSGCTIRRG